jgi:hypothetical protein
VSLLAGFVRFEDPATTITAIASESPDHAINGLRIAWP